MDAMDGLEVRGCERCDELCASRSRIVNGTGPADADLLFVGEAPGEQEDQEGEPFIGRSGDVLGEALRANGLARADVRITNCVRCRPPDNRDPTGTELGNCRGYLEAEIGRVDPTLLVTLGKVPAEHLLGRSVPITNEAGDIVQAELGEKKRDLLLSVHPAATLYDPSQQESFERAIERAAAVIGSGDQATFGDF
jgi:DNA polymerase